jgi:glutamate carboxypeptidase
LFDTAAKVAADLGIALEGVTTGGGSDGNFTAALGVPTLDGLGADGAGAHTFDEHILLSSVAPRTALLANLMMSLEPEA